MIAYEFDYIKVLEKGNKFKCKACDNHIPVSSVKSGNRKSKNQLKKERFFFLNHNRIRECA
jgi:polyisoprenoid-binding protein YceI